MKRLGILAVLVLALSLAATASAAKKKYAGPINPSGELSFTLKSKQGEKNVLKLGWEALPVNCGGTPQTSSGTLNFAVPVKRDAFKAEAVLGKPDKPKAEAKIDGKFQGRNAAGSIRLVGSKLPIDAGGAADCTSGRLRWSASR